MTTLVSQRGDSFEHRSELGGAARLMWQDYFSESALQLRARVMLRSFLIVIIRIYSLTNTWSHSVTEQN